MALFDTLSPTVIWHADRIKGEIFPMQLWQKIKVMRCVAQKKARDQKGWNESRLQQREKLSSTECHNVSESVESVNSQREVLKMQQISHLNAFICLNTNLVF